MGTEPAVQGQAQDVVGVAGARAPGLPHQGLTRCSQLFLPLWAWAWFSFSLFSSPQCLDNFESEVFCPWVPPHVSWETPLSPACALCLIYHPLPYRGMLTGRSTPAAPVSARGHGPRSGQTQNGSNPDHGKVRAAVLAPTHERKPRTLDLLSEPGSVHLAYVSGGFWGLLDTGSCRQPAGSLASSFCVWVPLSPSSGPRAGLSRPGLGWSGGVGAPWIPDSGRSFRFSLFTGGFCTSPASSRVPSREGSPSRGAAPFRASPPQQRLLFKDTPTALASSGPAWRCLGWILSPRPLLRLVCRRPWTPRVLWLHRPVLPDA
ncbi:uncharacterized protein LOC124084018 [Marmota monax]|uniref:uncharacterized protein LOC124084018 n=1 Tax=Marmota monax TaxID=9995 RepID=UPI001EB01E69|nr:uncharacterized protein LOC124084018 [Marmota monax]